MAYQLIALTGPLEGDKIPLKGTLLIGRTTQGLNLPDPLVSVNHARIEVRENGTVWVVDLGSKHGTTLNGISLGVNEPFELQVGDVLTAGESQLQLDSQGNRLLRVALWMMLPAWILVAVAFFGLLWISGDRPLVLTFRTPVRTPAPKTEILVPPAFARSYGLSLDSLTLLDVRDDDRDGIDEIWLGRDERELVVTFGAGGSWTARGSLPKGCTARADTEAELSCNGTIYQLHDGRYVPVLQTGAVVWVAGPATGAAPTEPGEPPVPSSPAAVLAKRLKSSSARVPYQVDLRERDSLSGFLASRGVHAPVHWIMCEDQGLGLPAQARIETGEVVPLKGGCAGAIRISGGDMAPFEGSRVVAVALTATAWNLLPKDLSLTLTGATDDRLATADQSRQLAMWRRSPVPAAALELLADGPASGARPDASEDHRIEPTPMLSKNPVGRAQGGRLLNSGTAELQVGKCSYRVRTGKFRCATVRGCVGATFLDITERGCGDESMVLRVGYGGGVTRVESEHAVIQVVVDAVSDGPLTTQIIKVQFGIRPN